MSSICNVGGPVRPVNIVPDDINLAALTELEVESGSAALAGAVSSVMSAIASIELHENELIASHMESALDGLRSAQWHYDAIGRIDAERGATSEDRIFLKALDLSSAPSRWKAEGLIPDVDLALEELVKASKSGQPSMLLEVFTRRLNTAERVLQEIHDEKPTSTSDLQLASWRATAALLDAVIAGQGLAVLNRESYLAQHAQIKI